MEVIVIVGVSVSVFLLSVGKFTVPVASLLDLEGKGEKSTLVHTL